MSYGYDRSQDPRADKVTYRALAAPSPKPPLTPSERAARRHDWQSYSAVVKFKDGNEDVVTVQAIDEEGARHNVGLRIKGKGKIINLIHNGEAW